MARNLYNAQEVANKVIKYSNEKGYSLTNLRLQKLMYFIQGYSKKILGEFAFTEDFEAWNYGPVIPGLYLDYSHNGATHIDERQISKKVYAFDKNDKRNPFLDRSIRVKEAAQIDDELGKIIEQVCDAFSRVRDFDIVKLTHTIGPWKDYYDKNNIHIEIPKDAITSFFLKATNE